MLMGFLSILTNPIRMMLFTRSFLEEHNIAFYKMIDKLKPQMKSQLTIFRAYEINGKTIHNPVAFGFTNMKEPFAGTYTGSFYEKKNTVLMLSPINIGIMFTRIR